MTTLVRLSALGLYWWPTCWRATISPLAARQIARPDTSSSVHARGLPSGTGRCSSGAAGVPPYWRAACKAIHNHTTLNFYPKKNILSWSALYTTILRTHIYSIFQPYTNYRILYYIFPTPRACMCCERPRACMWARLPTSACMHASASAGCLLACLV
jgi:hypothetical protein